MGFSIENYLLFAYSNPLLFANSNPLLPYFLDMWREMKCMGECPHNNDYGSGIIPSKTSIY